MLMQSLLHKLVRGVMSGATSKNKYDRFSLARFSKADIILDPTFLAGADGDPIGSITTRKGGVTFTSTGTARPTLKLVNGRKIIRFDGTVPQVLLSGLAAMALPNQNFTMVFVVDNGDFNGGSDNDNSVIASFTGSGGTRNLYMQNSTLRFNDGTVKGTYGGILNAGTADIFTIWGNASGITFMCNGVVLTTGAVLAGGDVTQLNLGKQDSTSASLNGDLYYAEFYNTAFANQAAALVNENRIRAKLGYPSVGRSDTVPYVLVIGNSITEGYKVSARVNRWVEKAIANLGYTVSDLAYTVRGYSGATTANLNDTVQRDQWTTPFLHGTGRGQMVIIWELTNSIFNTSKTAAQTYADLVAYCAWLKLNWPNVTTCVVTAISRTGAFDSIRTACNTLVLAGTTAVSGSANLYTKGGVDNIDAVFDAASVTNLTDNTNTTYFNADGIHLTDTGQGVMATAGQVMFSWFKTVRSANYLLTTTGNRLLIKVGNYLKLGASQ